MRQSEGFSCVRHHCFLAFLNGACRHRELSHKGAWRVRRCRSPARLPQPPKHLAGSTDCDDSCVEPCLGERRLHMAKPGNLSRHRSRSVLPHRHDRPRSGADRQGKGSLRGLSGQERLPRVRTRDESRLRHLGWPRRRAAPQHPPAGSRPPAPVRLTRVRLRAKPG